LGGATGDGEERGEIKEAEDWMTHRYECLMGGFTTRMKREKEREKKREEKAGIER